MRALILPIGGSASRMQGIPKFLLPINSNLTLIENHIQSALNAGYDQVYVVSQELYVPILEKQLAKFPNKVQINTLTKPTATMCETLITSQIETSKYSRITVGLPDTVYLGSDALEVYRNLISRKEPVILSLFKIRKDQIGKLGQLQLDGNNRVTDMRDKDPECSWPWIWGIADFDSKFFAEIREAEAHVGISIQRWMGEGIPVSGVKNDAEYYDCGTFDEYAKYIKASSSE